VLLNLQEIAKLKGEVVEGKLSEIEHEGLVITFFFWGGGARLTSTIKWSIVAAHDDVDDQRPFFIKYKFDPRDEPFPLGSSFWNIGVKDTLDRP
jgi:hypothetical protein